LANALVHLDRVDEAIQYYKQALEIDPRYANAHCNLGTLFAAAGALDKAIAHYEKALEFDPKLAVARKGLEKTLAAQGRHAGENR